MANNSILAQVSVVLGANVAEFQKGFNLAASELKGFRRLGESMKDFGSGLSKAITLPILGVAAASIKMAADMEKAGVGFTTMLGSAEKAGVMMKDLQKFAAETPFEFPEIQQAAKSLLAFGIEAGDITNKLRQIGDISAGIGAPMGEIAEIFGKAKVQGRLFAEDINQLTGRGIPIIQELAKQFGVTEDKVKDLVKNGQVNFKHLEKSFESLTSAGSKFGGLMQAQSETLSGLFSTLKDNAGQALADIGKEIVETFDLKNKAKGLIDFIQRVTEGFKNLNPETKRMVIAIGGVAAAAGPVVLALGAVAAVIPTIVGGFAVLAGPVGMAALALTGVASAAALFLSTSKSTIQSLADQRQKVKDLETGFVPLIDRYDALKAKSKLSREEQTELNSIIAQIAKTTPGAIIQFDKYGKAMDISSTAAREFVKAQQGILKLKNEKEIQSRTKELQDLDKTVTSLMAKLKGGVEIKTTLVKSGDDFEPQITSRALSNAEKQELGFRIEAIKERQKAIRDLINELSGVPPAINTIAKANDNANKKPLFTEGQQKILDNLRDGLKQASAEYEIHNDSQKYTEDRINLLSTAWKGLLANGLTPQHATVQRLASEWNKLTAELKAFQERGEALKMVEMGDWGSTFKIKMLPVKYDDTKAALSEAEQAVVDFSKNASGLIKNLITDSIVTLGDTLGQALAGNGFESGFNALLGLFASFAQDFGKLLIATSLAASGLTTVMSNPALWPLGLAAGVALVAAGGAAKSYLAKGLNGGMPSNGNYSGANYRASGAGAGYGEGKVDFVLRGDELHGVLTRRQYRAGRFGAR